MNNLRVEGSNDELSGVARVIGLLGQHLGYCCPILRDTQASSWTENGYNLCMVKHCVLGAPSQLQNDQEALNSIACESLDANKNLFKLRSHAVTVKKKCWHSNSAKQ